MAVADDRGADTRYRLLETIRQYGEERLGESGETQVLRSRHCDHYISFAAEATPKFFGPNQLDWGRRIADDGDNFHAAMGFALDSQDVERATGLLCQIPDDNYQADRVVTFDPDPILTLPGVTDHPGYARVLIEAAGRAFDTNDFRRALHLADTAEDAERRLGPCPGYFDIRACPVSSGQSAPGLRERSTCTPSCIKRKLPANSLPDAWPLRRSRLPMSPEDWLGSTLRLPRPEPLKVSPWLSAAACQWPGTGTSCFWRLP
jgi:hypothetical protein